MADNTKIEWADASWSPVTGCSPISAGCDNCYAQRMARRLAGRFGYPETPNHFDVTFHPDRLIQPFNWKKPRRIFVCSMGDIFHKDAHRMTVNSIMVSIIHNLRHTFLILTKRPNRMKLFFDTSNFINSYKEDCKKLKSFKYPIPNIWLGVTVEHPDYLWRIDELLKIPAAVRFVSVEPMLEEIMFTQHILHSIHCPDYPSGARGLPMSWVGQGKNCNCSNKIDWVICGPETGPGARECKPEWIADIYEQCKAAGVPFFDKRKNYLAREFPKLDKF